MQRAARALRRAQKIVEWCVEHRWITIGVTALAPSSFDSGDIGCMGISNVAVDYGRVTIPGGKVLHKNESYSEPVEKD